MKCFSLVPALGFLAPGKTSTNKIPFRTLLLDPRPNGTYLKQYGIIYRGSVDKLNKNKPNATGKIIYINNRMFSTNVGPRTRLMDLEVAMTPGITKTITQFINSFLIKNMDNEFDMDDFVKNTHTALVVVARLLSELRFSELDGLLTKECIQEVERNVRTMEPAQRQSLAVELDDIYFSFPYDTKIIRGGSEEERIYFQVTVAYHICKDFSVEIQKHPWVKLNSQNKEKFTAYNCRFIKEFTKGTNDQWIINGINVLKLHELTNLL